MRLDDKDRYSILNTGHSVSPDDFMSSYFIPYSLERAIYDMQVSLPELVDYGMMVGAEPFSYGQCYVYEDAEGYLKEFAIQAMRELDMLKELFDQHKLYAFHANIGDTVYILRDREVISETVRGIHISKDGIVFDTERWVLPEKDYEHLWFTSKDAAVKEMQQSELKRIGLIFDDE